MQTDIAESVPTDAGAAVWRSIRSNHSTRRSSARPQRPSGASKSLTEAWRFASIELREPPKAEVKAWRPGDPVPRTALAVLWNREDNQTWEGVVDLTGDAVVSWTHVPDVTPHFTVDEYHEVDEAMRAHPDVIAALAARGITDMSLVTIEVWTYGKALMPEQWRDRRLGWCDIWYRETPEGNLYAHPVSGLKVVVDVNTLELLEIENDHDHGQPEVDARVRARRVDRRAAHRPRPAAHHPARRRLVHPRRHRAEVAELDDAARASTTARARSSTR